MKITIQGQDYTAALDAAHPLTIERKFNEPSICQFWLSLPANGSLAAPSRFQSLAVTGDDGTLYFTGYIAVSPLPEYAGMGLEGPRYRTAIQAVSDELLLDQLLMPPSASVRRNRRRTARFARGAFAAPRRSRRKGFHCTRWATSLPSRAPTGARAPVRPQAWRGPRIAL